MLFSTSAIAATILAVVSAQSYSPINPDNIDIGTKSTWCSTQVASCTLLCLDQKSGGGFTNTCDPTSLSWSCVCADGTVPNATQYSQTIPYFECTYEVQDCVNSCPNGNPTCAEACVTNMVCGATDPTRVNTTSTATLPSTTASSTATGTGAPDDDGQANGFGATATDGSGASQTGDDSSSVSQTGSSKPNAGSRLECMQFGAHAFTIMLLSVMCGAFTLHM